ncbi:aconitase family protein [Methylobacterium sp. J-068]|uniref:aconitase family protein n=1 Tax=Methylobacterium sp. J-068 TaxID=2836649 RepID=UPI001FBA1F6F|nr:aconitase family protein [Methylobacterium sp. J-068]MCJ2033423.1 aconitase family protein [Methylobacterium sp. J-068]
MPARTLHDKLVDAHPVRRLDDATGGPGASIFLYVDRTGSTNTPARRPSAACGAPGLAAALAVVDHVNPTAANRVAAMPDPGGASQVRDFDAKCRDFGIERLDVLHPLQGIEHVVVPETRLLTVSGALSPGVTAKDIVMTLIRRIGADGATDYAAEFAGCAVTARFVEGRMTIGNMARHRAARPWLA